MGIDVKKLKSNEIPKPNKEIDFILEQGEMLYSISEGFIKYRNQNGNMTQKALAEKLSVNQSMIAKLESGNYNPTFKLIHKLTNQLTDSSEMFVKILENMIRNIKKVTNIDYQISLVDNNQYQNYYKKDIDKKENVVYLFEYKKEGDKINERNKSKISAVG